VSISLPPSATRVFNTSAHASRRVGSSPTSNTWEVPSLTTGKFSPECGIGRAINPDVPVFSCLEPGAKPSR
jgi:hypothetical protein